MKEDGLDWVGFKFVGFLSNTDDSVLTIPFDFGFRVRKISFQEAIRIVKGLINTEDTNMASERLRLTGAFQLDPNSLYLIENSRTVDSAASLKNVCSAFFKNDIQGYLQNRLELMRLYKGNIRLCLYYIYSSCLLGPGYQLFLWDNERFSQPERFSLTNNELRELTNFLEKIKLPLTDEALQLALDSFDGSFSIENIKNAFLSLMISLECLFNDGRGEITYKLARGVAVSIGNTVTESQELFKRIKGFYDKRSCLVHQGRCNISLDELSEIRLYVRKCIRRFLETGKSKKALLEDIKMSGYKDKLF